MKSDEIRRIASLCRIALSDAEIGKLGEEFSSILKHIGKINQLDLADTEPVCHPFDVTNVYRRDEISDPMGCDELMKIAPSKENGLLRVPRIIDPKS